MPSSKVHAGEARDANAPEEDDGGDGSTELSRQGAVAGPSSPSRRRRRPNPTRRRSSSISAAASLLSSYSTSKHVTGTGNDEEGSESEDDDAHAAPGRGAAATRSSRPSIRHRATSAASGAFAPDAATIARDAKQSFFQRKASPYHMALVTVVFSLASDMPLASQFKVYSFMMCKILQMREGVPDRDFAGSMMGRALAQIGLSQQPRVDGKMLPSAPELPTDPICDDTWVQDATSTYAAAMATVGALLGLLLLNRCSKISERFGRKPLLLLTHILLALSTLAFRLSVWLPTMVGVTTIYVAVVVLEASAGAPLRIAIQNYVIDTTTESQRAAALSFTDGFGQVGAFPSGALGGWLSAVTQNFFAPFYASIASYLVALSYILVFVPESKKRHQHTIIDDFEEWHHNSSPGEAPQNGRVQTPGSHTANRVEPSEHNYTETTASESYIDLWQRSSPTLWARIKGFVYRFNFLAPLSVFIPRRRLDRTSPNVKKGIDWRVFNLAIIVLLEETFQVFLLPMLLLYNTKVFGYDVVQNGYLVSLLQGTRALYLTVIFPAALGKIRAIFKRLRAWQAARNARLETLLVPPEHRHSRHEATERTPLLEDANIEAQAEENKQSKREERGRLDIIVMFFSYILAGFSFGLLSMTRSWSENYEQGRQTSPHSVAFIESPFKKVPPYVGVALAIVGVQLGSGATSLRTALLVNAVSEQEDEREEAQALRDAQWRALGAGRSENQQENGGDTGGNAQRQDQRPARISIRVHHERHQTRALAANQILCTAVYAVVPLVTSRIFGTGLQQGRPELVWMFKSAMAFVCAGATVTLLMTYGLAAQRQQQQLHSSRQHSERQT